MPTPHALLPLPTSKGSALRLGPNAWPSPIQPRGAGAPRCAHRRGVRRLLPGVQHATGAQKVAVAAEVRKAKASAPPPLARRGSRRSSGACLASCTSARKPCSSSNPPPTARSRQVSSWSSPPAAMTPWPADPKPDRGPLGIPIVVPKPKAACWPQGSQLADHVGRRACSRVPLRNQLRACHWHLKSLLPWSSRHHARPGPERPLK